MTTKIEPKTILYHGDIALSDFYRDIDRGFTHFFQADYTHPLYAVSDDDTFVLNLAPKHYFSLPIIEIVNYFMAKRCAKGLSSMSLTALHEAISNSLLWGLLQVERPSDMFDFHTIIDKKLAVIEREKKTICITVQNNPHLKVRIINPYDKDFDFNDFKSNPSPYMRGGEIMRMFSDVSYDKPRHTLELTFGDVDNVYQTVAQSQ
ncbi:MAG: hypothetical protein K2X98_04310 [Alphaproteobacteria bacterium]|nr:hypothetical protein [Alphaproteobacteria bacterium]